MQVSRRLVVRREVPLNAVKEAELLTSMDITLAEEYCKSGALQTGLSKFRETIPKITVEPEKRLATNKYLNYAMQGGRKLCESGKILEAMQLYRDMLDFPGFPATVYKQIGLCMKNVGNADMAIKFLEHFEEISPDKEDVYIFLGDLVYTDIKDNKKAIGYYEKAIEKYPDNYTIYNMLGHLYSTEYQDKFKDKQIYYLSKAFELAPTNRIVVKNLAYVYGKFHEVAKADEMYAKLMYLNPTHSDLHAYGAYLVKHKRFTEGFKFLQHRFQKEDLGSVAFPEIFKNKKKRWNMKMDISNKTMLVHFEQGFGDAIMFSRFLDDLKKRCKEVILVVQKPLVSLFEDSDLGVEIYTEPDVPNLKYDYWIPLMDLPIVCETTPETIPKAEGYLKVPQVKIDAYKKQFINNNNKFKIGIAYEGTLASKETNRDIPLEYLYPLMRLPDVEVYSFQVDDLSRQMDRVPPDAQLIRLGKTFRNWEDTACAMNCMDLIVTTDNGVMNLAGALGKKTFGIFNTVSEWRWFKTDGDDVVWYKSVKPFTCPTSDAWEVPVRAIMEEVDKIRTRNVAKQIKSDMIFAPKPQGYKPTPKVADAVARKPEPEKNETETKPKAKSKTTPKTTAAKTKKNTEKTQTTKTTKTKATKPKINKKNEK